MHSPQELSRSATLDASECCGTSAIRVEEALLAGRNAYSTCFACCELEAAAYNALPNGCMCFMKPHAGAKCWRRAKERTRLDWVRLVTCVRGRSIIVTKCLLLSERSLSVCAARSCHAILLYMLSHTPRHSHSLARLKALLKYAELELTRAKAGHVQHTKRSHDIKQSLFFLSKRCLKYIIWHRDCIHAHHHTEIQIGSEVEPKSQHYQCCTILIPEEVLSRSPDLTAMWKQIEAMKRTEAACCKKAPRRKRHRSAHSAKSERQRGYR